MYNSFFEIDYPASSISQDLKYLYLNKKLKEILDGLKYACNTKEGIIKLTGDVGSGKTMICKALANELSVSVDPPLPWSGQLQPNIGGWQELLQLNMELLH